jgi:hypothetical protein
MRAKKVDTNQNEIVQALRQVGASVDVTSGMGEGFPDLVAGFRGQSFLLEVKYRKGRLTKPQEIWHRNWKGQVAIVHDVFEALFAIGATN